jgi:hypothetical protein
MFESRIVAGAAGSGGTFSVGWFSDRWLLTAASALSNELFCFDNPAVDPRRQRSGRTSAGSGRAYFGIVC